MPHEPDEPLPPSEQEREGFAAKPAPRRKRDEDDDEPPKARKKRRPADEDEDDEEEERPRPKRRARQEEEDEDEDEADEPREIVWTTRKRQLNLVQIGLTFMLVSQGLLCASYLALALTQIFTSFMEVEAAAIVALLVMFLLIPALGGAMLCHVVGLVLNCFVPKRAEGRGLLFGSILTATVAVVLGVVSGMSLSMVDVRLAGRLMLLLLGVSAACNVASICLLLLYLGQLARYLGDEETAKTGIMLSGMFIALIIAFPLLIVVALVLGILAGFMPGGNFIAMILVVLLYVGWLGAIARFEIQVIKVILRCRKLARAQIYPDEEEE